MPLVRDILFDLGGVLTVDPWQSLLLTPGRGVADRLGLDRDVVRRVGRELWSRYSRAPAEEADYWRDFCTALGREIPSELVGEVEIEALRVNPMAKDVVDLIDAAETRWGFISDNTSFWYRKQLHLLGLDGRVDPAVEFLSFEHGVGKADAPVSLFDIASGRLDPAATVVIDDRAPNIRRALSRKFNAVRYSMHTDGGNALLTLVRKNLG